MPPLPHHDDSRCAAPGVAPTVHDMTVFRLYRAWSSSNPIFTRLCEGRFHITRREWRILATAVARGSMTSSAVAQAAGLDAARTSRAIGTLCEKGWLVRMRDAADARTVRVQASDDGRGLYQRIMPVIVDLNEQITQDLSPQEIGELRRMLDVIAERGRRLLQSDVVRERPRRGAPAGARPRC